LTKQELKHNGSGGNEFVGLNGSVWGSQRVDKMGNDGLDAS